MKRYLTLDDVDPARKRVLLRSDLNVPLEDAGGGVPAVADDFRLRAALPTIERLRKAGAVVVVASHLGRPKGFDPAFSMKPVGDRLAVLGGFPVTQVGEVVGAEAVAAIHDAAPGDVVMLENTRFEPGETKNDPELARRMAEPVDLFVNDAFGTAHRAHASNVGVTEFVRSAAGPLLVREVEVLTGLRDDPRRPFVVVLGGAKVSDKLGVIKALLPNVDRMLIGGGMCFTLLAAQGYEIGRSLLEESMVEEVREVLRSDAGSRISLPSDIVVGDAFSPDATPTVVPSDAIPGDAIGLDIGPETAAAFAGSVTAAGLVFWNGPMGVFEWEPFRSGTEAVARAMAETSATTVVGGGDTVAAVRMFDAADAIDHVSTGGGAGLELLEGKPLPGLVALERWA